MKRIKFYSYWYSLQPHQTTHRFVTVWQNTNGSKKHLKAMTRAIPIMLKSMVSKPLTLIFKNGKRSLSKPQMFGSVQNPQQVAILIDGANARTAEQFLLMANQSKKVKFFGQRTAGA